MPDRTLNSEKSIIQSHQQVEFFSPFTRSVCHLPIAIWQRKASRSVRSQNTTIGKISP